MMQEYIYSSEKVRRIMHLDAGTYSGCVLENLITGRKSEIVDCGFEICYSFGEHGKKSLFSEKGAYIKAVDEKGYLAVSADGCINVKVVYAATVHGELLKYVTICPNKDLFLHYVDIEKFVMRKDVFMWQAPHAGKTYLSSDIARLGQPLYVGDMFFGLESPVGDNSLNGNAAYLRYHAGRQLSVTNGDGAYTPPPAVIGSGKRADFSEMRRAFFDYVESFARPARFRIQYNSWYDNMLDISPDRIKKSFTSVYEGAKTAGLRDLDCYVVDDGWAEYKKSLFWQFNDKFEKGFSEEAALTSAFGSSFGVWFGPRGGYTAQTVKYAKLLEKIGYHVNRRSRDICTADKKYIEDLCKLMGSFCEKFNVKYFKIDGFAKRPCRAKGHNHPQAGGKGYAFYVFHWEQWIKGFEHIRSVCPDVCLNITSYVNCSPWFLKWADYVWMNNASDMGYAGKGSDLSMCLNYRDGRYRDFYEKRQLQFPAAHLYNHEPCYALRNYNTSKPNGKKSHVIYSDEEFRLYMKCCMMRGSGLAELYFSPDMMDNTKWKDAADILGWAERNFDVLSTSQFFGGRPEKGEIYGYYAVRNGRYVVEIRNSGNKESKYRFDLPEIGRIEGTLKAFEIRFIEKL